MEVWAVIFFIVLLWLYFMPSYIAFNKQLKVRWAIFVLNLFLGLTAIGWLGALIWACASNEKVTD